MKKILLMASSLALLALAGCNKESNNIPNPSTSGELAVIPMNGQGAAPRMTKGYVEGSTFVETAYESLHGTKSQMLRTMQISSFLTPQNGEAKNYFVDKTYSARSNELAETTWWNTNTVGGEHAPIYWPVGGTLDFLAYSVSAEETGAGRSQNISAVWDESNAAAQVTLTVPGENTQNDILFASAYGVESKNGAAPVAMTFDHAQAWLEFVLSGSTDEVNPDGIVTLNRIELENVYNAGTLTIRNNGGNATAKWDFSGEEKQSIEVDDFNANGKLTSAPKYLDMLIPQQTKTSFVIYYTLGSNPKELSYKFTTDQKTWLMGEKYIYNINITTSEVTVEPKVTKWNEVKEYSYTVKTPATTVRVGKKTLGTVDVALSPSDGSFKIQGEPADDGSATYTCDTWGGQVTLTATPKEGYYFKEWSDGETENPRTFTIIESVELPEAVFAKMATITVAPSEFGTVSINGQDASKLLVIPGSEVELKATTGATFKFSKWGDDNTDATRTVTVIEDITYTPYFEVGVEFVEIEAKYDGSNTTSLKWATQNLSITDSGKKTWKKFTYYNDDEIFVNGDYFQWAAYAGYCGDQTAPDKGLLIYDSFTSTACGDTADKFTFKSAGEGKLYRFNISNDGTNIGKSPYYESSAYTAYLETGEGKAGLSTLESTDDVASIILGSDWRMPTPADFQAMYDATYWVWDATDKGYYVFAADATHTAGTRVTGVPYDLKKYNALLFFPAAGDGNGSSFSSVGSGGHCWSSSLRTGEATIACYLDFFSVIAVPQSGNSRYFGYSVRPVSDPSQIKE